MLSWNPIPKRVYYYSDESSFEPGHAFTGIGGLAVPGYYRNQIKRELREIKIAAGLRPESEVKWSKTTEYRYKAQHDFADYLARLVKNKIVDLHIVFFPIAEFNNRANNGREGTVGRIYNDMLIFRPFKFYGPHSKLYLRPDKGKCSEGMEPHLENAAAEAARRNREGWRPAQNVRECLACFKPKDSAATDILQLVDVTLGALTARRENRSNQEPKTELSAHVLELYEHPDLTEDIGGKDARNFSIWNFEGRGPKKKK